MSSIDIRIEDGEEVTEIVFADEHSADGYYQAYKIINRGYSGKDGHFTIEDKDGSQIIIYTVKQVQSLIKALNKAIELGWVK